MPGDDVDELYGVRPEEFTARRTQLAAAAKKRGDGDAAKRISAARKPTMAAWVVNRLANSNQDVKQSLSDLRERLRAAHAAMDGAAIRALSTEQRSLVDELARAAFEGAEVARPSATLREDVVGTLQAAIADPEVADRLGRLAKAEQWSGFGEFGSSTAVFTAARGAKAEPTATPARQQPARGQRDSGDREEARAVEEARSALAAAERAKGAADSEMSDRQTDLAVARLRRDEMRQRLDEAERSLDAAESAFAEARKASRDAAEAVKEAKSRLKKRGGRG